MPRPQNTLATLAGAALHYDRLSEESYGTRGRPARFHVTPAFERKLEAAFEDLWDAAPFGQADVVASAGTFVNKRGAHGEGRALDLDAIFWPERTFVALHYPQERRFYLGIEAVLRRHFGTVLNYRYNPAHRDHLHLDDLAPTGFVPEHRSRVLFLQMSLTHLFGHAVAIDGLIGPETRGAARRLLHDLGLAGGTRLRSPAALDERLDAVWMEVLDAAVARGFGEAEAEGAAVAEEETPLALLREAYAAIEREVGGTAARMPVETALTRFARHEETAQWLDQFRS